MAYSGKFTPKNPKKYIGDPKNIVYRSRWELQCFRWCDNQSTVKRWASEEIVVPYQYSVDEFVHRYYPDLYIEYTNGKKVLVEIKPDKETRPPEKPKRQTQRYVTESMTYIKNQDKWEAAQAFCKVKGWKFEVWTEKTLEKMGLLPKKMTKLKPLGPMKKPKKGA